MVELHGEEAAEVARHVTGDATWHRPPRCERVLRLESSAAWRRYAARRRGLAGEAQERLLLFGTTVEVAEEVQRTAEALTRGVGLKGSRKNNGTLFKRASFRMFS